MKLLVALLLNALLLAGAGWWLRRAWRGTGPTGRPWLLGLLGLRLAVSAFVAQTPSDDTQTYQVWGQVLTAELWAQPAAAGQLLQATELRVGSQVLSQYSFSNILYVVRLLSLLNLATGGSLLLNTLYISFFAFAGAWTLACVWARLFPRVGVGWGRLALLGWPSLLWWTSSVSKEALLLGAEAGFMALALPAIYGRPAAGPPGAGRRLLRGLGFLGLAYLAVRVRFFYALPLLGLLLALATTEAARRRGWLPAGRRARAAVLALGLGLAAGLGLALGARILSPPMMIGRLYAQYQDLRARSADRPHLDYPALQPTAASLLAHAPLAAAQVVLRPWLGEARTPLYLAAALENLLLLALLLRAGWAAGRGGPPRLPRLLAPGLLLYCFILAAFIGLSTPNLGTLHRYRALMLPWLLLALPGAGAGRQQPKPAKENGEPGGPPSWLAGEVPGP